MPEINPDSAALNEINPEVFPASARRGSNCGVLKIGDTRATDLVAQFGSPLYVIDENVVRQRARAAREAFASAAAAVGTSAEVYYASKAFLCVETARWVAEEGLAIDVASGGELLVALTAGVDPAKIGFHGNNKSQREIEMAVKAGVGTIILDSRIEITRVAAAAAAAGVQQGVRLRVNSGVHASTHSYLATSHEDQKFGLPLADAADIVGEIVSHKNLSFRGLHCHIGSQIFDTSGFRESARRLLASYPKLSEITGAAIPEVNLGGGFGIAYLPSQVADAPDFSDTAAGIAQIVAEVCADIGIDVPKLAFEPGRSIVGPAGVTLYTVGTVKAVALTDEHTTADDIERRFDERLYVSVDGGMSDNARPALYESDYHVRIANRRSDAEAALVRVVGKHCESGDIVVYRDLLPADVAPGDVLAVAATGAYCWSLSSNYNYVPRPPVVAVKDGEARVIVRGETEQELLEKSVFTP